MGVRLRGWGGPAGVLLLLPLAGCGDPAPDPSVAPIEIVLEGCSLNRDTVAAGTHDLSVVGSGSARVLDQTDEVVAEQPGSEAEPERVALTRGPHTVECLDSGGTTTGSAELTVDP